MIDEHWFDVLNKAALEAISRRQVARGLAGVVAGLILGGRAQSAEGKKGKRQNGKGDGKNKGGKGNKNGKGKGKGKDQGNGKENGAGDGSGGARPATCGDAICDAEFVGDEVVDCMEKCGRCRIQDRFCVIEGSPFDPTKVATCCFEDQQCCQDSFACCPRTSICCPGYPESYPKPCCPEGTFCCAGDDDGCCEDWQICCPGVGCVDPENDHQHCGDCDNACAEDEVCANESCRKSCPSGQDVDAIRVMDDGACPPQCPPGYTRCGNSCVDISRSDRNCGGCGNVCRKPGYPRNEICRNGACECELVGHVWDDSCGGCANTTNYHCCDTNGASCPITHDCVATGVDSNGNTRWGCDASS